MYAKTLFLVDREATQSGVAGGFTDLADLGAREVHLQRLSPPVLTIPLEQIAQMGREANASLVALGVADPDSLHRVGISGRAAMPDHPLVYLGVNSQVGESLSMRGRILNHVLVPGDYSVRSSCVAACLARVATSGTKVVTLVHAPDWSRKTPCAPTTAGELERVDAEWVDRLKRLAFSAGVEEVRFLSSPDGAAELLDQDPAVSLILVGATCNDEVATLYARAAERLISRDGHVPALMLTAESCGSATRRLMPQSVQGAS